ncbi:MAG: ATP-binding protein, partial [Clostridia bacterium]|nr:ATP-binding protein [Clostridia bacterium]
SNIHDMFAHARQQERAVIFLDEVEALTLNRHSSGDSACYAGIIAQLLTEIQGFEDGEGNLMLIAATNKPWAIDPAFLRPGRFDEKIYVPLPDEESRRHMFDVKMTGVPTLDLDYAELARLTPHFSGADIDHLCEKVKGIVIEALIAGEARPDRITMEDYRQALQGIQRSVTSAEEQALTQWRLDDGSSFSRRAV